VRHGRKPAHAIFDMPGLDSPEKTARRSFRDEISTLGAVALRARPNRARLRRSRRPDDSASRLSANGAGGFPSLWAEHLQWGRIPDPAIDMHIN
jgi:hypothetical protein